MIIDLPLNIFFSALGGYPVFLFSLSIIILSVIIFSIIDYIL